MPMPWEQPKSLEDAEQEDELLDKEVSIAQKRAVLKRLKNQGLSLKNFGGSLKAAINWMRNRA